MYRKIALLSLLAWVSCGGVWPGSPSVPLKRIAVYGDSCCAAANGTFNFGVIQVPYLRIEWNSAGVGEFCENQVPQLVADADYIDNLGLDGVFIMCGGNDFLREPPFDAEATYTANMAALDAMATPVIIGIEWKLISNPEIDDDMESLQASILADVVGTDVLVLDFLTQLDGTGTAFIPDGAHPGEILQHDWAQQVYAILP